MFVKTLCLLSTLVAVISCTHSGGGGGHSNSFREQDGHGNYKFGYNIKDKDGGENFREEKGDGHGNVYGSYSLDNGHGGKRIVHYVADKSGFRAQVKTNEPGTTNDDAADAIFNGIDDHNGKHYGHQNNHQSYDNHNNYNNDHDNHNNHDNGHNGNYDNGHNSYDDSHDNSHYYD